MSSGASTPNGRWRRDENDVWFEQTRAADPWGALGWGEWRLGDSSSGLINEPAASTSNNQSPRVRQPWEDLFSLWDRTTGRDDSVELNHAGPDVADEERKLDAEITDAQSQIAKLQELIQSREAEVYQLRSLHAPITRLPDDVLGTIFELACPAPLAIWLRAPEDNIEENEDLRARMRHVPWGRPWQREQRSISVFLISQVCRRWRRISLNRPLLWSRLCFRRPEMGSFPAEVILARSKGAPLELTFDGITCRGQAWHSVNCVLKSCLSRTKSLHLKGCPHWKSYFLSRQPEAAPLLEELSIDLFTTHCTQSWDAPIHDSDSERASDDRQIFSYAPRLRHLTYSGKLGKGLSVTLPTILSLVSTSGAETSLTSVYGFLTDHPQLQSLSLDLARAPQSRRQHIQTRQQVSHIVCLANLRKCRIEVFVEQLVLIFHLSMPAVESLCLQVHNPKLDGFLPPAHTTPPLPNLRHLSLEGLCEMESAIILRAAPGVSSLSVAGPGTGSLLWALSDVREFQAVIAPCLRELRINADWEDVETLVRDIVTARQSTPQKILKLEIACIDELEPEALEWVTSHGVTVASCDSRRLVDSILDI